MRGFLRVAVVILILKTGSSQSVIGFIGDEVLLPCTYPGWLPDKVNASWWDRNNKVVLDIINGKEKKTDPRVSSYPDQYKNGILSVLMKYLRADDAGLYECHIHGVGYDGQHIINLIVTEKPTVKVTSRPTPAPGDLAVPSSLHPALLEKKELMPSMKQGLMTLIPQSEKPTVKVTSPPTPAPGELAVPSSLHPALVIVPLILLSCFIFIPCFYSRWWQLQVSPGLNSCWV